jgi:lipoic acid synthetase
VKTVPVVQSTFSPDDGRRPTSKPPWLKVRLPSGGEAFRVAEIVRRRGLHTICGSARCPNVGACWAERTATFLILGNVCTRACGFCAVAKGRPEPPDPGEPEAVAAAVAELGLRYAVVTSVTRDDLPDGGAAHFVRTIRAVRARSPETRVELLIPDFGGDEAALDAVLDERPNVLNHNLETVERLYPLVRRPAEAYRRSLRVLARAAERGALVKSGLMLGLGETRKEIRRALIDLKAGGCGLLTIGQYLKPGPDHAPVARYWTPEEFATLRDEALALGFLDAAAGPLVRSSFDAGRLFARASSGR